MEPLQSRLPLKSGHYTIQDSIIRTPLTVSGHLTNQDTVSGHCLRTSHLLCGSREVSTNFLLVYRTKLKRPNRMPSVSRPNTTHSWITIIVKLMLAPKRKQRCRLPRTRGWRSVNVSGLLGVCECVLYPSP